MRFSEFLWQEGHTVFASEEEASSEAQKMLEVYQDIYEFMAVPAFIGKKSENERFAGAVETLTVEIMAKDGKAIQGATSHYLGTNFAKVFDVNYLGADGKSHLGYQNSWGLSWRAVGALIMVHGDDNGLRLPPNIAPIQVVIVPIYKNEEARAKVLTYCRTLEKTLEGKYRLKIDERDGQTPGFKFNYWEVRGVPIRLEIGLKEVEENKITIFRRDNNTKETVAIADLKNLVEKIMAEIHKNLYNQAKDFSKERIYQIKSWDEINNRAGWFEASWSEDPETEKQLKEKYGMVSRVLLPEAATRGPKNKTCFISGQPAKHDWLFAKSY